MTIEEEIHAQRLKDIAEMHKLLEFEIYGSWWAWMIWWDWGKDLVSDYYIWKTWRKFRRYKLHKLLYE